jgi:L-asparagine transporter-like permease
MEKLEDFFSGIGIATIIVLFFVGLWSVTGFFIDNHQEYRYDKAIDMEIGYDEFRNLCMKAGDQIIYENHTWICK